MDWQSIETAPKDGTIIRGKDIIGEWESTACWCNSWCKPLFSIGGRMPGGISFNEDHQPTHWQLNTKDDKAKDTENYYRDRHAAFTSFGSGKIA